MHRREFLKAAGSMVAFANVSSGNESPSNIAAASLVVPENKQASLRVEEHKIIIHTHTQSAVIEKGFLTSLINKKTGEEFIKVERPLSYIGGVAINEAAALQLIYRNNEIKFAVSWCPLIKEKYPGYDFEKSKSQLLFHSLSKPAHRSF